MKKLMFTMTIPVLMFAACTSTRGPIARATLSPTSGNTAQGTVEFRQMRDGAVKVDVSLTNVPAGARGFHVHEFGSCADNGNAAGGHFNPTNMPHASPEAASHHAGDFGNIEVSANGEVRTTFNTRAITVTDGPRSVVGKAVIVHAKRDDLVSQPTGDAGARIACGVIELQQVAGSMQP